MITPDLVRESVFEKCGFQPRADNTQVGGPGAPGPEGCGRWSQVAGLGLALLLDVDQTMAGVGTPARPGCGPVQQPASSPTHPAAVTPSPLHHHPTHHHHHRRVQIYSVRDSSICLTGTAEIPLGGVYMDKILAEAQLPIKMAAYGHCFRTEAGAAGSGEGPRTSSADGQRCVLTFAKMQGDWPCWRSGGMSWRLGCVPVAPAAQTPFTHCR